MVDGLNGLRHDAVVCGNDQDGNIGDVCTSCTHGSERFVSRRIQECDVLALISYLVCTDMLCDAASLACGNVCIPDAVQDRSLTMVNVTHNYNNWAALFGILGVVILVDQTVFDGHDHFVFYLCAQFLCHQRCGVEVDFLIDGSHNAQHHQLFDDLGRSNFQTGRQFTHRDHVRDADTQLLLSGTLQLQTAQLILLCLTLVGIALLVALCRLLVDLLLFGGILVIGVFICRSDLLIALVILIQIYIRATGIDSAALFCGNAVRRCHLHFYMETLAVFLCLCLLLFGLFMLRRIVLLGLSCFRSCRFLFCRLFGFLCLGFLFRSLGFLLLFVIRLFLFRLLFLGRCLLFCRFLLARLFLLFLFRGVLGCKIRIQALYLRFLRIILQCQVDFFRCQTGHTLLGVAVGIPFLIESDQFLC